MRHITISGHSLGAAVATLLTARATLLTARAQKFLQELCANKPAWQEWPKKQPLVTGVMYAAPHVGNRVFTEDFNARVNARRVVFVYDLTSQVRCCAEAPTLMCIPDHHAYKNNHTRCSKTTMPLKSTRPHKASRKFQTSAIERHRLSSLWPSFVLHPSCLQTSSSTGHPNVTNIHQPNKSTRPNKASTKF
jgi:hypothetical protein